MATPHKFIISLGSNLCHDEAECNLSKAELFLTELFGPDVRFSSHYSTPGIGSGEGKIYINSVAIGLTSLSSSQISCSLKSFEIFQGRTPEVKSLGIVPIDLDLLSLGGVVFKPNDLNQQYVLQGLNQLIEPSSTR